MMCCLPELSMTSRSISMRTAAAEYSSPDFGEGSSCHVSRNELVEYYYVRTTFSALHSPFPHVRFHFPPH
jgi:hypothetical protein